MQAQLVHFLREELAVPADSIAVALRHDYQTLNQVPMVLWQYGLINLEQLERILDWLDGVHSI